MNFSKLTSGRINRKSLLFSTISSFLLTTLAAMFIGFIFPDNLFRFLLLLFVAILWSLYFLIICIQRLHDLGLPGYWVILILLIDAPLIPLLIPTLEWISNTALLGWISFLILLLKKGQKSANKYGEIPSNIKGSFFSLLAHFPK